MAKKKKARKKAGKAARKAPAKASTVEVRRAAAKLSALDRKTLKLIETTAGRVRSSINKRVLPELKFPIRSLSNVSYRPETGYFELGRGGPPGRGYAVRDGDVIRFRFRA